MNEHNRIHDIDKARTMAETIREDETRAAALRYAANWLIKRGDFEDYGEGLDFHDHGVIQVRDIKTDGESDFSKIVPSYFIDPLDYELSGEGDIGLNLFVNRIKYNQKESDEKAEFAGKAHDAINSTKR